MRIRTNLIIEDILEKKIDAITVKSTSEGEAVHQETALLEYVRRK